MGGNSAVPIGRPLPSVHGRALGEEVELFFSTFVNKVDRKGRVSVPATFRAAVADQSFPGIIVFPSFKYDGARRQRHQADGGDERANEYSGGVFRGAREPRNAVRLIALAARSIPRAASSCPKSSPSMLISPKARRLSGWARVFRSGSRPASPSIRRCCASALAAREPGCRRWAAPPSGAGNDRAAIIPACTGRSGDRA